MACPITTAKFVGTFTVGLSTGLSYSIFSIALPALQSLPTASAAAQALAHIQTRMRRKILTLSNIAIVSLVTAFALSSPRRRHPYLILTSVVTFIGGLGLEWGTNHASFIQGSGSTIEPSYLSSLCGCSKTSSGSTSSRSGCCFASLRNLFFGPTNAGITGPARTEDEESSGGSSEIEIVEQSEVESAGHNVNAEYAPLPASVAADLPDVNGEQVKLAMEREYSLQRARTWIMGIAFSMGVIGIWGDRS
ncbi:hypothetical protein FQN57_006573 [Myotisia sp. PD_48]|nr:hypothetical protein FQN57_006573 [Myotisia sp. PD_48]